MHLLWNLVFIKAYHCFQFVPRHISTHANHIADDLSRDRVSSFLSKVPQIHELVSCTVSAYIAQLKQLAEYCNYGATLPDMLRDRLVCGIAQQEWQKRLLSEDKLTYDKAAKLLLLMESADQEVQDLSGGPGPKQVNRLSRGKTSPAKQPKGAPTCYRCSGNHKAPDCPFKSSVCHFCHKKRHIAAVRKTKQK